MKPAVDNGGRPDRGRRRTARQAIELRTINECACHGASETAMREHEAQVVPGDAKVTNLNCSYLDPTGDGCGADQIDLAMATQPRPAA